ncbi:hypothetical protein H0Z60_12915 [Ectothiorhodospiraceae bacterium WFHF3C12]|nr:hypothetical protein [Ectothiorhodospiraceae bacterium WFHF3C12]
MITILTGVPGSGKTLYAVQMLQKAMGEGRECFTDIEGCKLGCAEAPEDWRDAPDGALLVYDEAHQSFPATGKAGLSNDPRVRDLDEHRHRGLDLVFITQASTRLHHDIRKLASEHIHLQRVFGTPAASVFRHARAFNENDKADRETADQSTWSFPRKLYGTYSSAVMHTARVRLPRKVVGAFLVAGVLLAWAVYSLSTNDFLHEPQAAQAAAGQAAEPAAPAAAESQSLGFASGEGDQEVEKPKGRGPYRWARSGVLPAVQGCISNASRCMCFDGSGRALDLTEAECRRAVTRPMPINIGGRRRGDSM